jgi:hypothetical protein
VPAVTAEKSKGEESPQGGILNIDGWTKISVTSLHLHKTSVLI